jgi:hypothetical protein
VPKHHWVLTDVARGVWHDSFRCSPRDGQPTLAGSDDWSIAKRTLRGGLSDGVDVIDVDNGCLSVSILPTRGMGLWRGVCEGLELGWKSPVPQPVHPGFVNLNERGGLGWLNSFNEWLCRCGLAFNGPPGTDVLVRDNGSQIRNEITLHGRIANLPAHHVEVEVATDGRGTLAVTGLVDEVSMFGPCLRLRSTVLTEAGSNRLTILDQVTNLAGGPAEVELLYHTNLGRPFLEAGASFVAPVLDVAPRDDRSIEGLADFETYLGPTPGYAEQCYFFELAADRNGDTLALLRNAAGDKGVSLHFNRNQLPCFTLWKCTQAEADGYVTGLEPGTNFPNFKSVERKHGRLIHLGPGESHDVRLDVVIHNTAAAVAAIETRVAAMQKGHPPRIFDCPQAKYL